MNKIIASLLLLNGLFGIICPAVSPEVFNLALFPENFAEDELQQYLEEYINNPLSWERCKPEDIARLPLDEDIIERLIELKKTLPNPDNWQDIRDAGRFNRAEIQVIRLFFTLPAQRLNHHINIQNYTSLKDGEPPDIYRQLLRGKIDAGSRVSVGFVTERDPDERDLWDYANIAMTFKPSSSDLVLGSFSYKFGWGHGLLFARNNLAFKSTSVSGNMLCGNPHFGAYTGTDENRYLYGAYVYRSMEPISFFTGFSTHRLDATVRDSLAISLRETGFHVTESELDGKDTLQEKVVFGGVVYTHRNFHIGGIFFHSRYTYPVTFFNNRALRSGCSVYQRLDLNRWHWSGEIAMLNRREYAVVQGLVFQSDDYSFGLQYRYFGDYFTTRLAAPLKEYSGNPGNERGLLMGFQWKINRLNRIAGYVDYFSENRSFEEGSAPDFGNEAVVQLYHRGGNKQRLSLRLKRKSKGNDGVRYQLSGSASYPLTVNLSLILRTALNKSNDRLGSGFSLAINSAITPSLDLRAGTTHFYSPMYDSRVYLYEPGIPMRFNLISLNGTGYRYFIVIENQFQNSINTAISYKYQRRRLISESGSVETFLLEFQMVVDL